ncbi:centromere-associated protein E isoform X2 [Kryptolebias marmoratus]|uniref:centromere-associated protein E isoform X2 n=1 Tax=Kryptolebias marmoratus TaxID=37003 RepID=UPI0007F92137|nr:centromere-associated protein E isoform X2 [Kryptolebias marmoratus]
MAEESAVKVCVRVRPIVAREELAASENEEPQLFWKADQKSVHQIDDGSSNKSFSFDRVFRAEETTSQVYQVIANPLVVSTVGGYNGTIFAYGQTSSGKTFTMMGTDHNPGVIPMAVEDVFKTIKFFPNKEFLLRVSYMEIYNETVTDLLVDSWKRKPLEVRETINKNVYVADLTEELVTSTSQVLAWIRKGEKNRQYAKTKMNQRSSRSHAIFRMILESRERSDPASGDNTDGAIIVSHLNLVDLAGSERASQTGAEGARFKEGCNINRSLFTLGQVIKKLTDENQKGFTNYRDSKLTRILQNSLGGNAKTVIICTITPFTLEETLSTLQFASTAKKMKNDPHVTEVSDDGALLKRYRNEIVDLKRRLQEVTSVTQTTETEKEVLSQLLQEKDQLQREQEDRIRNLTQLLVTSSNLVPAPRMPKRRVTWGGKMLRLARHSAGDDDGMSDLTFAEPFSRKGKAHNSCLTEIGEGDEFFDSPWGVPEEPSDDMDTSENFVTLRRINNSSTDFVSPDRVSELSKKVSDLKSQLEAEVQQKEEAINKTESLDGKVAELQLQLQAEAQQRAEAIEKMTAAEKKAADLERQLLQTEARQKEETAETAVTADKKVEDLERQVCIAESKQMRMEFAEIVQLCETLASEKDKMVAERDYLKQELGMFMEQIQNLEKENAVLSQELKEKNELNEFESLEANINEERENELKKEVSCLKTAIKSSEDQCLELQNKLQTLSEELKKKTEFAEELQKMSGKDLVQEVATLRRSLDDAEGVSRDTKKEWAFLRSENIALEELKVTLTAKQEKMEAEMNSLISQLETEKSRSKKMQSDLQKELNIVFDENTKLTTLLDGKVPQNLIDSVELGRTVAKLEKELTASREAEEALGAELEKLASFKMLPDQVENLTKQVCGLTEELQTVSDQRDELLSGRTRCERDAQQLRDLLQTSKEEMLKIQADLDVSAGREKELKQQCDDVTQQLDLLHSELERSEAERSQLVAFLEERDVKLKQLNEALERVQAEKKALQSEQSALVQSSAEEIKELLSTITSLRAEGDEYRMSLQARVDKATETDGLPQCLQQELQEQKQTEELEKLRAEKDALLSEMEASSQTHAEEVEMLQCRVASLREESDQLRETLEALREEKQQLRAELEDRIQELAQTQNKQAEMVTQELQADDEAQTQLQQEIGNLVKKLQSLEAERDSLLSEKEANHQTHTEEMEKLQCRVTSLSEERDQLQETLEALREKEEVRVEQEMQCEFQQQLTSEPQPLTDERETHRLQIERLEEELKEAKEEISQLKSDLQVNVKLSQELQGAQDEEEALQAGSAESPAEDVERLLSAVADLTAERDQLKVDLQENVEMMIENQDELRAALEKNREQKKQIKLLESEREQRINEHPNDVGSQLEELKGNMRTLTEELQKLRAEKDALLSEKEASSQTHTEEMERLQCRVASLREESDQLRETLEALREEKQQLRAELEDKIQEVAQTQNKQAGMVSQELQVDDEALTQLQQEAGESQTLLRSLQEELQEQNRKYSDMQRINQEEQALLEQKLTETKCCLQSIQEEFQTKSDLIKLYEQKEADYEQQVKILTEELANTRAERDALILEKEAENGPSQTEQLEKLRCRVTSLSDERDQLQETLEGLREEKKQLREELEDRMQMMQCEFQQQLTSEPQPLTDEREAHRLQIEQLEEKLENAKEEMTQLRFGLQENVELMTEKQEELKASQEKSRVLQEELTALKDQMAELESSRTEEETSIQSLKSEIQILTEELESVKVDGVRLLSEKEASSQEMETLRRRATSISEERDQLQETLESLRAEEKELRAELEDRRETLQAEISSTQELLNATQDELHAQRNLNSDLNQLIQEKECSLNQKIGDLVKKLQSVEAERDSLLSEKEANHQIHTEEMEKLQCRVTSLSEERDRLQETLEGLKDEEKHLRAELEDKVQQLQIQTEQQACAKAEADASQQLLNEAKSTISTLKQQLDVLEQNTKEVEESVSSQLQDSTAQLQESFGILQDFIDTCSRNNSTPLDSVLRMHGSLKPTVLSALPKTTVKVHRAIYELGQKTVQNFLRIWEELHLQALSCRKMFKGLVSKDLAIFEERRLQDLLLSRAHAPTYSVKDVDFHSLWEQRLAELLDKRQLYLQKMESILDKLWDSKASYCLKKKAEIREWEKVKDQLERAVSSQSVNFTELDVILSQEMNRRSTTAQASRMSLQLIVNENNSVLDELKQLDAQCESQLREEKSKSSTLLQALEGAPLKTEVSLLEDNQKLLLQLRRAEENIKTLRARVEELEEVQTKANDSVSQHKRATQLLQTELQDTRALLLEKDDSIHTLKKKLRESEKKESPSAAELEKLHNKLFQMEVKLTSTSDEHQQEIQRMKTVLNEKEESLRKMKEALRKSQQQEDESFLQGKDLYSKLTHPKGVVIESSIVLEKTKLEEKVRQLQLKITELESLVSSQHADISKWKNRAIKLKGKSKADGDKMTSPCTPTKRGFFMTADSDNFLCAPKKILLPSNKVLESPKKDLQSPRKPPDSPKFSLLNSPKSRFFDTSEGSELLSRSRPTQFFDNSSLGSFADAAVGTEVKEGWPPSVDMDIKPCAQQ